MCRHCQTYQTISKLVVADYTHQNKTTVAFGFKKGVQ
jgi:hypothetical protein